jgi:hypothetical protein
MKNALYYRCIFLEALWSGVLICVPLAVLLCVFTSLNQFWIYVATIGGGIIIYAGWRGFQRLRWKRELAVLKTDCDFLFWLDRVDARLSQYGCSTTSRSKDDWFVDWQAGTTPDQAAKNFRTWIHE